MEEIDKKTTLQEIQIQDNSCSNSSKKYTFTEQIKLICSNITVEPIILLYMIPGLMGGLATQNLNLEKSCRVEIGYNSTICNALTSRDATGYSPEQEIAVQRLVSKMQGYKTLAQGFFPLCLMIFFGSWSDRHRKRKPLILLPIGIEIFSAFGLLLCRYMFYELSMVYTVIFEALPQALAGGWFAFQLGMYSYVSGICDEKSKTVRIGAVSIISSICIMVGTSMSGIIFQLVGYYGVYWICAAMMSAAFAYTIREIKDTKSEEKIFKGPVSFVKDFFNFKHVKATYRLCFKEGPSNRKNKMKAIIAIVMLLCGPTYGEILVLYLCTRKRFGWNELDYSIFATIHFVVQLCGSVFCLTFFAKRLKMNDATLGIIAIVSKCAASLVYAFSPNGTIFYLGIILDVFNGAAQIACRAIMAKIVAPHELGQSNSLFGAFEAIMPLICGPLYSYSYNYTIGFFPGAIFILTALIHFPVFFLFGWLYFETKKEEKKSTSQEFKETKD